MFSTPLSPRLILTGIAATALLATVGGLYVKGRSDAAAKARASVEAAQAQARVSDVTAKALDTHTTEVRIIRERFDHAIQVVQQAPGADTPVDPDLLRAWRDGLRDIETGARGGDNPAKPSGTLQTP
jgi:hypothetical protein